MKVLTELIAEHWETCKGYLPDNPARTNLQFTPEPVSKLRIKNIILSPFEQFMRANHFDNFAQVSEAGGVWTIKTSTTLKTMELKFKVYPSV